MKRYINTKTSYGVETIDELDSEDFTQKGAFRAKLRSLVEEYSKIMCVYVSSRSDKAWRDR